MSIFDAPEFDQHEQVLFVNGPEFGLRAIIAIHHTTLGPALGGCRMWDYADAASALTDALRLSAGMTAKNALANLDFGGGKAVIIGDPRKDKTPDLFRAIGRAIERLGGRYITAEDVGVTTVDMDFAAEATGHVRGTSATGLGDPSPYTALGVYHGILAATSHRFGGSRLTGPTGLAGLTVSLKGLGSVGFRLAERLHHAGAQLIVSDINKQAVARAIDAFGAASVDPDDAHRVAADIFAPCALGGDLNAATIPEIAAAIVAGAANNQLLADRHGEMLKQNRILYAPDYVINAGGLIALSLELTPEGYTAERALSLTARIGDTLAEIFHRADTDDLPTNEVADKIARERVRNAVRR